MSEKNNDQSAINLSEDFREGSKNTLNKYEYDLYHEEDDVAFKVIRIKHINLPNKGDKWKVFEDNKNIFTIEGSKLTNKEKSFLKTVDGMNFLINQSKLGIKSINYLKIEIKKLLK
jgi:hypothetical protein